MWETLLGGAMITLMGAWCVSLILLVLFLTTQVILFLLENWKTGLSYIIPVFLILVFCYCVGLAFQNRF